MQILQSQFDSLNQQIPGQDVEFLCVSNFQEPLSYSRWKNFQLAIKRVIESRETTGYDTNHYFYSITKMVRSGIGIKHAIPIERGN